MDSFKLTQEQIDNLKNWKNSLNSDEAQEWYAEENKAEAITQRILRKPSFIAGENLTSDELDELFSNMRGFSNNRNLTSQLYNKNGLALFNAALRNFLHGSDEFPKRVDELFKLKNIGIQTLSQFLIAFDSTKYPLITRQTMDALETDAEQEEAAFDEAMRKYNITNEDMFLDRTLDFLRETVIFTEIRRILGLEKYTQVNNLLWFGQLAEENEEPDAIKSIASVSIERDLRNFLAQNPHVIESGLSVIQTEEYDTKNVGRIDILCSDTSGKLVVIELKKGRKADSVVGQILRYIGWVSKNLSKNARGIIIVNEPDEKLEYALLPLQAMLQLKYYRVNFEVSSEFKCEKK